MNNFINEENVIKSYGLIIFVSYGDKIYYLLQQNRNTFEFIDFIRGLWRDVNCLPQMFSLMTEEERDRIRNYTFEELWKDLFVYEDFYRDDDYKKSLRRFEEIKEYIPLLITQTKSIVSSPQWGFPKGKKNYQESNLDCAIRETEEETRIPRYFINVKRNMTWKEEFKGTDGKKYYTQYYLGYMNNIIVPSNIILHKKIRRETLSEEVQQIKWLNLEKARGYLNNKRYEILKDVERYCRSSFLKDL